MNRLIPCLVAAAATTGSALGDTPAMTDARVADLTELVGDLQREVRELRAASGESWLTEQRADEIRGLVQDVLADADTRASLLQSGMTAGHDGKFFLASADGGFRLNVGGQVQTRFVYNSQDEGSPAGSNSDDTSRWGFEIRRSKLQFTGHVVDPTWTYALTGAFERSGGDFRFEDAYIAKDLGDGWKVRAGSFKAPFNREEMMSSSRQLLVDRSLVNERFNLDRAEGVELSWKGDQLRFMAMYSDGVKSRRTSALDEDTEFAVTGRVEFLAMGDWGQFKDLTSWRGSERAILIGGAIHYQKDEYGTGTDDELEDLRLTADISYEADGYSFFAAFIWNDLDNGLPSAAGGAVDYSPWGVVVQGGLFLSDEWEVFARYEFGDDDGGPNDATTGLEDLSVVTVGFNRYWNKHGLKWTTDVGYGIDPAEGDWGDHSGVGWRSDDNNEDGQAVLRSQLQLLF